MKAFLYGKKLVSVLLVLMLLVGLYPLMQYLGVLRIHIRANSNSPADQAVKYQVLAKVQEAAAPLLAECKTLDEVYAVVQNMLPTLQQVAQQVSGLQSRARLGETYFPFRNYKGQIYPAGLYTALVIEIGSGKGDNWWCVLFPRLCFAPPVKSKPPKKVEYRSFFFDFFSSLFA